MNTANLFLDLFINVVVVTVDADFSTVFLSGLQLVFVTINGNYVGAKDVVGKLIPRLPRPPAPTIDTIDQVLSATFSALHSNTGTSQRGSQQDLIFWNLDSVVS